MNTSSTRPPPPTGWVNPAPPPPPYPPANPSSSSTRAPGAPPPYAFVARVYRRSLRPVVVAVAGLAALWSFIWGISALDHLSDADEINLKTINIVLGALYLFIGTIELIGIIAAWKQALALIRVYALLSVVAALTVVAAESVRFSAYFTHKKELIDNCTAASTGDVVWRGDFWGTHGTSTVLTQDEAQDWCNDSWGRSVWAAVAWLIVASIIGCFMVSLAFSYYHQTLSPQQIPPSQAYAMNPFNPPYNPSAGYQYPAPSGPPPGQQDYVPPYDPAKLPEYGGVGGYTGAVGDAKEGTSREDLHAGQPERHV